MSGLLLVLGEVVCVSVKVRFSSRGRIRNRARFCVRTGLGLQQWLGLGLRLGYV